MRDTSHHDKQTRDEQPHVDHPHFDSEHQIDHDRQHGDDLDDLKHADLSQHGNVNEEDTKGSYLKGHVGLAPPDKNEGSLSEHHTGQG